ncbi:hypothetical protein [Nonlabens ponticola]|uniref:Uncharacterized protein n=1 Tax=Nonlabens ponticola TaxID=2496866 RepID=A0A3S9N0J6_9FLAO|nr:hypothetical protein [Nonlabens ponticola]AZQ44937.1 hypothetical protein EJ995_12140 [Nonlabens ponticola]
MIKKLSKIVISGAICLCAISMTAQIGVNTNEPTANLDVNGTLRVRSLEKTTNGFQANGTVLYIMGVDQDGNVIPIEIGENIVLENNILKVQLPEQDNSPEELPNGGQLNELYESGDEAVINNLDLGIVLPGDGRASWPVFKLENGSNDEEVQITGIRPAPNGTMAYLYPTSGSIMLRKNDNDSEPENRIEAQNNIKIKKNEMALIMYDAQIQKWIVVSSPQNDDD